MLLENNKKMFLYEVDPLFFYDDNDDGFGDFSGFIKKIDYFNFLNIDGIVFPDIFNQEDIILKNVQVNIFDKYGNINELKKIINLLAENKKEFFIEINLEKILNSAIIKTSLEDFKLKDISQFIEEENSFFHTGRTENHRVAAAAGSGFSFALYPAEIFVRKWVD